MRVQSCEPCDACERGCGRIVTPEGLLFRERADELAAYLRSSDRN